MDRRFVFRLATCVTLACSLVLTTSSSLAQHPPNEPQNQTPAQGQDANRDPTASPADVPDSAVTTVEVPAQLLPASPSAADAGASVSGPVIAIATMPAPASSFDITVTLTNLSRSFVHGDQMIRAVTLDCHRALNRQALTIESVFGVVPAPGGTATVRSGNAGPAVLSFTGFDFGESARFSLDPDTWDNPNFGATRADLAGCRVELVFFGTLRGEGVMQVLANGSVRATIRQTAP